jgi:Zn-dependent peptidase ImmA (M78 family)
MTVAKRWTKEDEEFLIGNYQDMSNKELAEKFSVTTISVQRKLSRLGLIRQFQKKWESTEEDFLKENYKEISDKELAEKFEVSEISIKRKLNRMGLKRTSKSANKKVSEKKDKATDSPKETGKKTTTSSAKKNEREYKITESYEVGEMIFHQTFDDKGKVIDKFFTTGGNKAIIVNFQKAGRKILMETMSEDIY